jgi:hypothetical protein
MPNENAGTASSDTPAGEIPVSPDNPCPFLRALVAEGFVGGHVVPLATLGQAVEAASGEQGLNKKLVGVKTFPIALIANGLNPLRLLRSWWSGAVLDHLRNGPLDKHGVGSRILDATAHVNEAEIARLAEFGKDRQDPAGGTERGLTAAEITTYMNANFARAKGKRRWYDRILMIGEWPVLLKIMGKGEGKERYLSVAEVRTLFVDRRLPERIVARLKAQPPSMRETAFHKFSKVALVLVALALAAIVAIIEFPDQAQKILPDKLAQLLPPPLPDLAPVTAAYWLDQNWSTEDRHWFHHASQGTATFPVPYAWFVALEQPGIHLFTRPGLFKDSNYLERFGFLPSPKTIRTDAATLLRFGYSNASDAKTVTKTEPVPASVAGLKPTPVENFDGLPVGFARLAGPLDPITGQSKPDMIGLSCAACHTGHINYKGVSVRFDGGPGMVDLLKLEEATGLAIAYTLKVPGRFKRFAARVLGPDATRAQRDELKDGLSKAGAIVLAQHDALDKMHKDTHKDDTEEGYGRLDALNRIGNQVFSTDFDMSGLTGFDKNLEARDAPVSFPPIWTVPWFLWAQYDASIEQPLIRNAGEALGVQALVNLSPDSPKEALFRSTIALENLVRIEDMLRGGEDPFSQNPKAFGGLQAPKWPSQIFAGDPAWKIDPARVSKGRALYAEICVECHLGPVDDPTFDTQFPDQSVWKQEHWDPKGPVLREVQKTVDEMGTDAAQAKVLGERKVSLPGFLDMQPARDLGKVWGCTDLPDPASYTSTNMPYSIALMSAVDLFSRKWMDDHNIPKDEAQQVFWGFRKNCPNPEVALHYRARPLNGVWATAPYLHNGSVPSLYWMLMPAAQRPKQFCMGFRDFDPQQVGFHLTADEVQKCENGETLFAATTPDGKPIHGNSNLGHSFEGPAVGPKEHPPGVIGRLLTDQERYDLIEYLKTL